MKRPSSGSGVIKLVIGLILVGVVIGCSILAPVLHIKMLERELAQLEKEITSEKYAEVKKGKCRFGIYRRCVGKEKNCFESN